ncbi:uncharacterized protein EI90DRAFT_2270477 [Cantharellus anzutake]|uniref:uncharacterized protein n=1 Tax=Cantharellus anzutake TaxID=1750568 RepID=UPI0019060A0C|nr:uncharacterized protein EI90DRAFT_2270477 [Cantharellus anzutake]KAF8339692.1 hypothetical protein EI90DRAFT_2270477 [Cantharellus anzutake]
MKFNVVALAASVMMAGSTLASVNITFPNSNVWWVANSLNLLQWTCQDPAAPKTYTVVVFGQGSLAGGLPIISTLVPNYDCSINIPPISDLVAGTGYQVALTNTLNRSDIFAESQPFEIKAEGSPYPPQPSNTAATYTSTATSAGNATSTSSPASSTSKAGSALAISPAPLSFSAAVALVFSTLFA